MNNSVIVSLRDIVVEFDGQRILDGLNLDIHDKEFVTLLGSSGCGKTTTLRLIAGFLEPTSGKVLLKGEDITGVPPYKRPVNTVFQKYALFPHLNVMDNIGFGLNLKKVDKSVIEQKVKRMLKMAVKACKDVGKYVGICGQAPSDYPEVAAFLVKEGITSISLNPDSMINTWKNLAEIEAELGK